MYPNPVTASVKLNTFSYTGLADQLRVTPLNQITGNPYLIDHVRRGKC